MELKLLDADKARDLIVGKARNRMTLIYQRAADEVAKILRQSESVREAAAIDRTAWNKIEKNIDSVYRNIQPEISRELIADTFEVSRSVSGYFSDWLISQGFPNGNYFQAVPRRVVESIINGTVYRAVDNLGDRAPNWGLSKSIWGHTEKTIKDIHEIIAQGVANGTDTYSIAKQLEQYVQPEKRKAWDWGKVYPGTAKHVDYNSQRLARTLINHAYQQTFKEEGEFNPWIEYYIWHSVFAHGRTCQVCMDMDGNYYAKDGVANPAKGILGEMPLDHPNGLCYFTYEIDDRTMIDDLIAWNLDPAGSHPEIDQYWDYMKER